MKRAKRIASRHPSPKPRNPVARSPLLAKGGPHGKSTRAKRRHEKIALQKIVRTRDGDDAP
jgi:hypothetical protein